MTKEIFFQITNFFWKGCKTHSKFKIINWFGWTTIEIFFKYFLCDKNDPPMSLILGGS